MEARAAQRLRDHCAESAPQHSRARRSCGEQTLKTREEEEEEEGSTMETPLCESEAGIPVRTGSVRRCCPGSHDQSDDSENKQLVSIFTTGYTFT